MRFCIFQFFNFPHFSTVPPKSWSSCSLDDLQYGLQHGFDMCLQNVPTRRFFDQSTCGNGIWEEGEECDCGIPDVRFFFVVVLAVLWYGIGIGGNVNEISDQRDSSMGIRTRALKSLLGRSVKESTVGRGYRHAR